MWLDLLTNTFGFDSRCLVFDPDNSGTSVGRYVVMTLEEAQQAIGAGAHEASSYTERLL